MWEAFAFANPRYLGSSRLLRLVLKGQVAEAAYLGRRPAFAIGEQAPLTLGGILDPTTETVSLTSRFRRGHYKVTDGLSAVK